MAVAFGTTQDVASSAASIAGSVATYSSVAINSAASDRLVILTVGMEAVTPTISSATIDFGSGDTAMKAGATTVFGSNSARMFWLNVTSGTTATFKITFGGTAPSATNQHITIYTVTGAYLTVSTGATSCTDMDATSPLAAGYWGVSGTAATPGAIHFDIITNGGFLGVASCADALTAKTWTGATEDLDHANNSIVFRWCTAKSTTGATAAIQCTGATNGEDGVLTQAVFFPNNSAFGDLKAVGGNLVASVVNPFTTQAPVTVAVGDLIVVNYFEANANTATAGTDDLGNSYSALTGGGNLKAFYSVATVAGEATIGVTVTGGSGNDAAVSVAVFAGPFAPGPLDKNPAVLADSAEPYTSNLSTTLSQADELLVGYFGTPSASELFYDAPSTGFTIATQTANGNTAQGSTCISYDVVAVNTSASAGVGGATGTRTCQCGIATFEKFTALDPATFYQPPWSEIVRYSTEIVAYCLIGFLLVGA